MKSSYSTFFAVVLLFAAVACGTGEQATEVLPANTQIAEIDGLMEKMFDLSSKPDTRNESEAVMEELNERYSNFVTQYPEHEMAPVFLDRAANIARKKRDYQKALDYYNTIVTKYPDFEGLIEIKFLIAFVYDAELNDKEKAREQYQLVADEYPNHVFGRDAKARLANLHMSDEELIDHFEKNNKVEE